MTGSGDGESPVEIRFLGLPVAVSAQAQEHVDGLLREFTLIAASHARGGEAHVPLQLLQLAEELQQEYSAMTTHQQAQLADARQQGLDHLDLVYRVPPSIAEACVRLGDALDAADMYCQQGEHLLSLTTPPGALAYRRWFLSEFIRQIDGEPPVSWGQWLAAHPETGVSEA